MSTEQSVYDEASDPLVRRSEETRRKTANMIMRLRTFCNEKEQRYPGEKVCCCCPAWFCRPHTIILDLTTNAALIPWLSTIIFLNTLIFVALEYFQFNLSLDAITTLVSLSVLSTGILLRANHPTTSRLVCFLSLGLGVYQCYSSVADFKKPHGEGYKSYILLILYLIRMILCFTVTAALLGLLAYKVMYPRELGPAMTSYGHEVVQYVKKVINTKIPMWTAEQSKAALAMRREEIYHELNASCCERRKPSQVQPNPRKMLQHSVPLKDHVYRLPQRFRIALGLSIVATVSMGITMYAVVAYVVKYFDDMLGSVKDENWFMALVHDIFTAMDRGSLIAVCVTESVIVVQVIVMFFGIFEKLRKIRLGILPNQAALRKLCSMQKADTYVGFQVLHVALCFVIVLVGSLPPTVLLVLTYENSKFRALLWEYSSPVILTGLGTLISNQILAFLYWYLTMGDYEISSPSCYSYYSFFYTLTGIPLAAMGTLSRTLVSLLLNLVTSCRLDYRVYPPAMICLDYPYLSFLSALFVEEAFNNPIKMVFLAHMHRAVLDAAARRVRELKCVAQEESYWADDQLTQQVGAPEAPQPREYIYPALRCIYNAAYNNSLLPLPADVPTLQRVKVQQRFWLMVMLHHNPSLRHFRKLRTPMGASPAPSSIPYSMN